MTMIDYNGLIGRREEAENRAASLEIELRNLQLSGVTGDDLPKRQMAALEAAIEVIQFAVANYPPEAVRGWPHERLAEFGRRLEGLPIDQRLRELAIDLQAFARDAKVIEEERTRRRRAPLPLPLPVTNSGDEHDTAGR